MHSEPILWLMALAPSPTLTQRFQKVKRSPTVKRRKADLRSAGHTYAELAKRARVTYSMAWKWMNGERKSAECERAFAVLVAGTRP
jgi:hypothetical protein